MYQPIIDLTSGLIVKAEALVRWQHPVRGLLNPAEFISVAESSGMIIGIGDWVFQQAARQALQLQALSTADLQICVNKSASQFRDDGRRMGFRPGIYAFRTDFRRGIEGKTTKIGLACE